MKIENMMTMNNEVKAEKMYKIYIHYLNNNKIHLLLTNVPLVNNINSL